jgi:hypothetical protein
MIRKFKKALNSFNERKLYLSIQKLNLPSQIKPNIITPLSRTEKRSITLINFEPLTNTDIFEDKYLVIPHQSHKKLFNSRSYKNQSTYTKNFFNFGMKHFTIRYNQYWNDKPFICEISNFKEFLYMSSIMKDQTLFIKETLESSDQIILIIMPEQCGKTLILDMLKRFLSIQYDLFNNKLVDRETGENYKLFFGRQKTQPLDITKEKLNIFRDEEIEFKDSEKICCTKPVIFLNLNGYYSDDDKELGIKLRNIFIDLYQKFEYLRNGNDDISIEYQEELKKLKQNTENYNLGSSVVKLSELLYRRFGEKVWILIDEYDKPIIDALFYSKNDIEITKCFLLLKDLYTKIFENNPYLEKAVLTGTTKLSENFAGIDNIKTYNIDDYKFSQYFGINEEDLETILEHFKIVNEKEKANIKEWYNGYKIIKNHENREFQRKYCTFSVVRYLNDKKKNLVPHLHDTILFSYLKPLLKKDGMKQLFERLTQSQSIHFQRRYKDFNIEEFKAMLRLSDKAEINSNDIDMILSYLYNMGYLTNSEEEDHYKLPNLEIREIFLDTMTDFYRIVDPSKMKNDKIETELTNSKSFQTLENEFVKILSNLRIDYDVITDIDPKIKEKRQAQYSPVTYIIIII